MVERGKAVPERRRIGSAAAAMEDERLDEEGHRWPPYASREHDLRMQNRGLDYDPYEIDSRQPTRSGHYVDEGQRIRGPANMKTLLANQQLAGRRKPKPSAVAHHVIRKEGTNWILIVGGALVTALGVMIAKRQKTPVPQPKAVEKALLSRMKDHVHQSGLTFRRESTGSRTSELSAESPYSGDPFISASTQPHSLSEGSRIGSDWGDEECSPKSPPASYYAQFAKGSNNSNRVVITPTSPPGSYRGADTSATDCNDSTVLSPPARLGFSSRRDMVHRLRQQLKSRDDMILDMQAQISDQERLISIHQTRCKDLESRLEEANNTVMESNLEIQRQRRAVAEYLAGQFPSSGTSSLLSNRRDAYQMHQQDDSFLLRETRRLAKELQMREEEKQELERLASLRIKEHELVVQKLQMLESHLAESRKSDFGKDLLLEAYEVEHENLEDRVDNLKRLIESKTPEKDSTPSMIGRNSLSGGVGINREENCSLKAEDFRARARNLMRSYSLIFEKNGEQPPRDVSSLKGRLKPEESSSTGDISDESETDDSSPALSEKLVNKLKQEVEQLSSVLAEHCETISEKRLETSRLVDEFQRQNALINDIQKKLDEDGEVTPEPQEHDWKHNSQYLSFSTDATSAAQVQELNHKLEEIAKRQRVEEEIADLSRHQVKIAELKQRVEKLLNRCNSIQDSKGKVDGATRELAMRMAATGAELAKQLDYQEEQARRTSREVQRLSASFELSSPYVPRSKKEELRKMLQDCSSESSSPPTESGPPEPTNMSHVVSPLQSRFTSGSEGNPKEIGDNLFDRAISVSSAEPATTTERVTTTPPVEGDVSLQLEEQCVYRPGLSGPSTRKFRRGFPINSGSGKEQSAGSRNRMARGLKKNEKRERKELVRSDSNTWVHKAIKLRVGSSPDSPHQKRSTSAFGEWSTDNSHVQSAPVSGNPWENSSSPVGSRRESFGSLSDSSTMRIGSPTSAGHNVSLETSVESTKSNFGRFLFDMETGDQVYAMNQDDGTGDAIPFKDTVPSALAPCTEMMAKLDLKEVSSPSLSPNGGSFGRNISGLSRDMLNAIKENPLQDGSDKEPESIASESSASIDSSLDALLSNTLYDLVLVCSAPTTPAETPKSSSLMSSKSDAFFPSVI